MPMSGGADVSGFMFQRSMVDGSCSMFDGLCFMLDG